MNLPQLSMNHRTVVFVTTAMLALWGFAVFMTVPLDYDPSFEFRTAAVVTRWPGTDIKKVEELVTYPVEEKVISIEEVDKVESTTTVGLSIVEVTLENSVTDVSAAWDKIRSEVAKITVPTDLGCARPEFDSTLGDIAILMLAVYQVPAQAVKNSYTYSHREMEDIAERLRDEIRLLPAVAEAGLYGVRDEAIFLEADRVDWSQLGLSVQDLKTRLRALNIVAAGGSMDLEESRVDVQPSGNLDTVAQLGDLVVHTDANGTPIYLNDVGIKVVRGYQDPPKVITRFSTIDESADGPQPGISASAVAIAIEMKAGNNVVQLGHEIQALLAKARSSILPADVDVGVVVDRPNLVETTIHNFVNSLIQAVLIVLGVAFLLLGFRMAMVMATAIPVVMLTTIGLMRFWDIELHQISIGSMIVALGLLVDNAIEVCDNVHRLLHEGYSRYQAAVEGSKQIALPMIIATGTTIAAFLPMAIALEGTIGEYSFSLPVVVSICLATSWVMAMSFTTVMAYWLLRRSSMPTPLGFVLGRFKRILPGPMRRVTFADVCGFSCRTGIKFKFLTVIFAVACFLGAVWMVASGQVSNAFFPQAARDQFVIEVYTPEGSPIHRTDEKCQQVEKIVLELSQYDDQDGNTKSRFRNMLTFVGDSGPRFESVFIGQRPAPHYALIIVRVSDYKVVDDYVEEIRIAAASRIAGARVVPHTYGLGEPIPHPISVRVHGTGFADLDVLRSVARDVEEVVRESGRAWDVTNTWGEPGLQLAVDIDVNKANRSGVTNTDVARTLNAYLSGEYLTTFREGKHQVPVYFRLPENQRVNLREIDQMFVKGSHGKIPLEAIISSDLKWETTRIQRYNMGRMIEVSARPNRGELASMVLVESVKPQLAKLEKTLPAGMHFGYGGEIEKTNEALPMIAKSGLISGVAIVFLLVLHYNSIAKTCLLLVMLPLAAAGAIAGLYIFDEPMGFMAQLGLLSLFGIVLNDGIVLVEFIEIVNKEKVASGEGLPAEGQRGYSGLTRAAFRECLVKAAQMRVTPIVLTTLTTVGGLIPLLYSGPMFRALAAAMMCGLIFATFMTLLVLPALTAVLVETFRVSLVRGDAQKGYK